MKKLITERFQQLAGIKPLYEQQSGTDNVYSIIKDLETNFGDLLGMAESLLKNHEEGKDPSEYDRMIGGDVEKDPAWPTIKNTLTGKELYMYFLFKAGGFQNIQAELPFGTDGDVERVISQYIEWITEEDFDANELASKFDPQINVKELGSGDIKQDRDILLQLMTTGNVLNWPDIPVSKEEMYKELSSGTLDSSAWHSSTSADTQQGINKISGKEPQNLATDKYASSLGGGTDRQGNPISEAKKAIFNLIKEARKNR